VRMLSVWVIANRHPPRNVAHAHLSRSEQVSAPGRYTVLGLGVDNMYRNGSFSLVHTNRHNEAYPLSWVRKKGVKLLLPVPTM